MKKLDQRPDMCVYERKKCGKLCFYFYLCYSLNCALLMCVVISYQLMPSSF